MFGKDAETSPELFPMFRSSFRGLELLDALEAQPLSAHAPSVSPTNRGHHHRHQTWSNYCYHILLVCSELLVETERQRETDRQTERQRERETDRDRERERERQLSSVLQSHIDADRNINADTDVDADTGTSARKIHVFHKMRISRVCMYAAHTGENIYITSTGHIDMDRAPGAQDEIRSPRAASPTGRLST